MSQKTNEQEEELERDLLDFEELDEEELETLYVPVKNKDKKKKPLKMRKNQNWN